MIAFSFYLSTNRKRLQNGTTLQRFSNIKVCRQQTWVRSGLRLLQGVSRLHFFNVFSSGYNLYASTLDLKQKFKLFIFIFIRHLGL